MVLDRQNITGANSSFGKSGSKRLRLKIFRKFEVPSSVEVPCKKCRLRQASQTLQASRKKRNQRITMKFLLHGKTEMPTHKTAHPAKPTSRHTEPFLQQELFSYLHTMRTLTIQIKLKPKLFNHGLQQ